MPRHDSLDEELYELTALLISLGAVLFDLFDMFSERHEPRLRRLSDLDVTALGFEFILDGL